MHQVVDFSQSNKVIKTILISSPVLAVFTLIIYLRTVAPGVWGFDSAEFASGVYSLGIIHPPGYPLYILLGRLFITLVPISNLAYKLNILSAIFASFTVLFLYEFIYRITYHRVIAWSTAAFFAFTNYFWQMSLVAEVYTLHTFFLSLLLLLIQSHQRKPKVWKLFLFSFLYGLSFCNHTSGILFAGGFLWLLFFKCKFDYKFIQNHILMLVFFLMGFLPYIYFPIRSGDNPLINYMQDYPGIDLTTLPGLWWMISGQAYRFFAFSYTWSEIPNEIYHFGVYLWRNYLGVGVILGLVGIYYLCRLNYKQTIGWLILFFSNVIFFTNYRVVDKDTMFLPAFLIWAVFVAGGLKYLVVISRKIIGFTVIANIKHKSFVSILVFLPLLPIILNWKWVDLSSKKGSDTFTNHVFENSSPNSIIIGDWSSSVILEYYQIVEGKRPDLIIHNRSRTQTARFYENWSKGIPYQENIKKIINYEINTICSEILTRKVYMIEYDSALNKQFRFIPNGDFFEIKLKNDTCIIE